MVWTCFTRVYVFYRDGFRRMTLGRVLWKVIIIKLLVLFGIVKFFFFPNYLNTTFETDEQRADHVIKQITNGAETH